MFSKKANKKFRSSPEIPDNCDNKKMKNLHERFGDVLTRSILKLQLYCTLSGMSSSLKRMKAIKWIALKIDTLSDTLSLNIKLK